MNDSHDKFEKRDDRNFINNPNPTISRNGRNTNHQRQWHPEVIRFQDNPVKYPRAARNNHHGSSTGGAQEVSAPYGSCHHHTSSCRMPNTIGEISGVSFGEPTAVDYDDAADEYNRLEKTFTRQPSQGRQAPSSYGRDLEEGGVLYGIRENLAQRISNAGPIAFKELGIYWDNLSIYGSGTSQQYIEHVYSPLLHWLIEGPRLLWYIATCRGWPKSHNVTKQIIHNVQGYCRPGEMLLVLGKPGAGCSTLLRVLGNQRKTYTEITGDVSYGGITPKELHRHYKGEVVYNSEEDSHFPTLTVRNTIDFALKMKTPSSRVMANRKALRKSVTDMLISMFGLQNCADTKVGNELIRGVSGGEKKRTSIAEQMATAAAITIWDGSTRGLDASSALDYVRSLRIVADLMNRTTIVTLYQASENIYNIFDQVMVLADGRCIYFGPAQEARDYFQSLGYICPARQTTADFLTGITTRTEAQVAPGMENKVPQTPEEFETSFRRSQSYSRLQERIQAYREELEENRPDQRFRSRVQELKMGSSKSHFRQKSPYQTTYWFQVMACLQREWLITLGNPSLLIFRILYTSSMAVIVGSLFYKLPDTSEGAFTRGGVLFFALLFNTLVANSEIPKCFSSRPTIYKQNSFAFYHPSAVYIAQQLMDIPIAIVQVAIFSGILYWMAGLQANAAKFMIFWFVILMTCLCLTSMFRLIGNACPDLDTAHMAAGVMLLLFILLTGYLIPPGSMRGYLVWIYWINPIAYGLKALVSNEFSGLVMRCTGSNLVPRGLPKYNNLANQVCTLAGARPGSDFIRGEDYIYQSFGFNWHQKWVDIVAVIAFYLFYIFLALVVVEAIEWGHSGYSTNVFKRHHHFRFRCKRHISAFHPKVGPSDGRRNQTALASQRDHHTAEDTGSPPRQEKPGIKSTAGAGEGHQPVTGNTVRGLALTWQDVNYTVPLPRHAGEKQLLHNVFGYVRPGEMTALMGASGAGKTTLLDVLAQRKNVGRIEGDILLNGETLTRTFRRHTGYCEQADVHNPYTTVREALRFSAYMRQPSHVSTAEKKRLVEQVIQLMEMEDIAEAQVGTIESGIGLSMEERKRLTIAVELVARPKVLFLDEPTSGLDAQASFSIVRFIRKLAAEGQTVLCTIHQPSSLLFAHFDRLLLLAPGGYTVYFGDLGHNCETLINYFESNGATKCPETANPAEYILDVIGSKGSIDWPQVWKDSAQARMEREHVANLVAKVQEEAKDHQDISTDDRREFALNYFGQCRYVLQRMFVSYWRDPKYNMNRILLQAFCGFILGIAFVQLTDSTTDLQNRVFAIFQTSVLGILIINQVEPQLIKYRTWFTREEASGFYDWRAFATGMVLAELPYVILSSSCFFGIFYFAVGLSGIGNRIAYFYIMYNALTIFAMLFGQAVASWTPNDVVASMINPIPASFMALFCGVTIPYAQMTTFWRRWMYWIDPYHYIIEGLLVNDLFQQRVECTQEEFFVFQPPEGQNCIEYTREFLQEARGYLQSPDATKDCLYCPYEHGQDFYEGGLDWSFAHRYRNFCIVVGFCVFNLLVMLLGIKFYRSNKR
ncbi:ATP-binding cassette transporter snq2, partial [Dispira parvispora]